MLKPEDFELIEKRILEKYKSGLEESKKDNDSMIMSIATVATQVSLMAIQEYHRKLSEIESSSSQDVQ